MKYFLILIGYILAFCLIKFRQQIGDNFGEPAWADRIGGIYNLMIILGVILFFWCTAAITGTTKIFLYPLYIVLGGAF